MQLQNAVQFINWTRMVIHAQVDEAIIKTAVAATLAYNQQGRRLLPSTISTGSLPCGKSCNQAITKIACCLFKRTCHRKHRLLTNQNISLARVVFPYMTTCPGKTLIPGKGRWFATHTDNSYLALSLT